MREWRCANKPEVRRKGEMGKVVMVVKNSYLKQCLDSRKEEKGKGS